MTEKDLQNWFKNAIAIQCRMQVDEIDIDELFANYGLDSVAAVTLSSEISEILKLELPPTIYWDYPSIAKLSEYLSGLSQKD